MKILISLPRMEIIAAGGFEKALFRPVCGVPILTRIIENFVRKNAVSSIVIAHPPEVTGSWITIRILESLITPIPIETVASEQPLSMAMLEENQAEIFANVPWNLIEGISVYSPETAALAEMELVRNSGKSNDGIFSRFNRRLCWSTVRHLARTHVKPNSVSFAGLLICILAALGFSAGHWSAYIAGALLFFIAGLCDEMDGMLARLTFQESAFGCWLESFTDYAGYLLVFAGMTAGLYRERGSVWLILGGLFLFGCLMSMIVAVRQRKQATLPDRPQDFLKTYYRHLEADSGNWISMRARQVQFLMKKSAIMHEIVFFSIFGLLPLFVALGAFCSNLIWILALYFGSKFFRRPQPMPLTPFQKAD